MTDATVTEDAREIHEEVLPAYEGWQDASVVPFGNGLINRTYLLPRGWCKVA